LSAKPKSAFVCSICQHQEPKWLGRCPECGSWNSFRETVPEAAPRSAARGEEPQSIPLDAVQSREGLRLEAGIEEVNRVLGGGIMKGSAVLLAGEPGTGKSTLMLQLAARVQTGGRTLYVSGEESPAQIRLRAERLALAGGRIEVFPATELSQVLRACDRLKPVVLIVDSIQTVYSEDIGTVPGTVNQVRLCAQELIDWAKNHGAALFLVGHVTKEGYIAGPKVVEHMVDTVLYFETGSSGIRLLRAVKNRFGSVDEIGIFQMSDAGLSQVENPAALFLTRRDGELPPGVVAAPVYEGTRVLLVEIQSLVVPAKGGISRVFSDRIDPGRVSRMAAVLEKHLKARLADQDLYVNVGGGLRVAEVGIELPLAMALYSARLNQPVPALTSVVGEVSLAGELRPVQHLEKRARAVAELSFTRLIHPAGAEAKSASAPTSPLVSAGAALPAGLALRAAATLAEAARICFTQA
jgi:DNA repair protein RadA/Sms